MTRLIHTMLLTLLLLAFNADKAVSKPADSPDTMETQASSPVDTTAMMSNDYITASLLVVSPSAEPYSLFGHCALRLQCPDHKMDYCFTFETPTDAKGLYNFFRGKAMGGFAAAPTKAYLDYYRHAGRGVSQHQLNLTPQEKLMLWQQADKEIVRGDSYRYNYLHTQCASMVIDLITSVLPAPVGYKQLPAQTDGSFRDQMLTESVPYPWSRFFWQTIMGPAGDETGPFEHKLTPSTLPEVWRQATLSDDNRHIISGDAETLTTTASVSSATIWTRLLTPTGVFSLLLILVVVITFGQWKWGWRCLPLFTDSLLLAIYTILALGLTALVLLSDLEATQWNWYLLVFNPLPLLLWAVRRNWLPVICAALLVAILSLLILTPFVAQLDLPHALLMATIGIRTASSCKESLITNKEFTITFPKTLKPQKA